MIAKKIKIFGMVQGVNFRRRTWDKAQELGIKGWVQNCEDGSVETHIEGARLQIDQMEKWCYKGSKESRVDSLDAKEVKLENFKTFEVKGENWW